MWHLLKFATTLFRCIPAFFRSRNEQALIELALRQQLATYVQRGPKPRITPVDRAFWTFLSRTWSGWIEALVIVQPDTVVCWHRKGFRLYWRLISKREPERPPVSIEQKPDHDQRQRWKTFLRNHRDGIAAMDFIVVPTVRFRLLHVWFVIGHGRSEILHLGVTAHPTSPWVVQQLRKAFPEETESTLA